MYVSKILIFSYLIFQDNKRQPTFDALDFGESKRSRPRGPKYKM